MILTLPRDTFDCVKKEAEESKLSIQTVIIASLNNKYNISHNGETDGKVLQSVQLAP